MPLPMVHLAIAVRAYQINAQSLHAPFLLGSLAPDAIHMRPNTDREDKNRTHYHIVQCTPAEAQGLVRQLVAQTRTDGAQRAAFGAGYAAHLLTDSLWQTIARPFFAALPPDLPRSARRASYYRETDQVDFNLYRRVAWRKMVWQLLAEAEAFDFMDLLTAVEIARWRDRTLIWFDQLKQEPGVAPETITDEVVAAFIEQAAQQVAAQCLS